MTELEKWKEVSKDHITIKRFFDWLMEGLAEERLIDININRQLDGYFQIDRLNLERERRQMLNEIAMARSDQE